ncbi:DegT/DnrJ/EryC1/StrS family aminotransferase [Blastopirellula marina]|uniref:Perosamine synthetase n=1 Tax=Blastopirellula marina TaxID=124 RepID=A0A2S8G8Z9_9BACT|nr:aminotransferase class V-fold PLP-dependent enzyme [Blastopirellula marina]PQO40897.1 perosamine synthetase [Blastopirellula marina]PTL45779.1 aminotransferase class V-fold PLP-dependent enzyme [Blastopirellula marina]
MTSSFDPAWNQWPIANDPAIRQALQNAYEDGSWGRYHGPHVERLEAVLAEMHNVKHAMVCASGTIAVQIALRSLNARDGGEVIVAAYDFPGNFRAIQDAGLFPVLVDIDPLTWCLDANAIEEAISEKTVAVIVSHLHGGLAPMGTIREIAAVHGIAVIEDACQATGAIVEGRLAGANGEVGVLSFGGSKLITAGRGGAILTDRDDLLQRAKVFCERGNNAFPLSELQAAVILPQIGQLEQRNQVRRDRVQRLRDRLCDLDSLLRPVTWCGKRPVFYKHAWLCDTAQRAQHLTQLALLNHFPLGEGFRGFFKRPSSQTRKVGSFAGSQAAAERTVLLHHPVLLQDEMAIDQLADWIRNELRDG